MASNPNKHVEKAMKFLFGPGINSSSRLPAMLDYLMDFYEQPEIFWPVFHAGWCCCDVTWPYNDEVMELFDLMINEKGSNPLDYLEAEDQGPFDALPDEIEIYRGCSETLVQGLAWTTDKAVAEGFAEGHRGVPVPKPVIATTRIPKNSIVGFYTAREESEVLLDPWKLNKEAIKVIKFKQPGG